MAKGESSPQAAETCLATQAPCYLVLPRPHLLPFLLSCRQLARVTVVDVEAVVVAETAEAMGPARALQAMATVVVVVVVVVAVAVVVATCLLSTEPQPPEEYAIFIGPLESAIAALTARTNTRQRSRRLRPPHNPQIILPTFSP
jgi:hypothetical protein